MIFLATAILSPRRGRTFTGFLAEVEGNYCLNLPATGPRELHPGISSSPGWAIPPQTFLQGPVLMSKWSPNLKLSWQDRKVPEEKMGKQLFSPQLQQNAVLDCRLGFILACQWCQIMQTSPCKSLKLSFTCVKRHNASCKRPHESVNSKWLKVQAVCKLKEFKSKIITFFYFYFTILLFFSFPSFYCLLQLVCILHNQSVTVLVMTSNLGRQSSSQNGDQCPGSFEDPKQR